MNFAIEKMTSWSKMRATEPAMTLTKTGKSPSDISLVLLLVLLATLQFSFCFPASTLASEATSAATLTDTPAPSTHTSIHEHLSTLSDQQVRKLLIEELKKEAAEDNSFSLEPEINGPAAPLSKLLRSINRAAVESDNQINKLFKGLPRLFPDLYKVFVSL